LAAKSIESSIDFAIRYSLSGNKAEDGSPSQDLK